MQVLYTTKVKRTFLLSSIYLGIWPHYIGNPYTNERGLSAGIDRLPRACLTSLADLSLQLHTTSGVAEIYICNKLALFLPMGECHTPMNTAVAEYPAKVGLIPCMIRCTNCFRPHLPKRMRIYRRG